LTLLVLARWQMGKSTLANQLSAMLGIPQLSQDDCNGKLQVFLGRYEELLRRHGAIIADRWGASRQDSPGFVADC